MRCLLWTICRGMFPFTKLECSSDIACVVRNALGVRAGLSSTDLCFHSMTNVTICVSLLNQVPFLHWKTTNIPTGWSAGFSHLACVASWSSPGGTKTGTSYGREWIYENMRVRELTSLPHILLYIPRDTEDILYESRILMIYSHFYYEHNTVQFV